MADETPGNGLPRSLRPGRYYSEPELASAAAAALERAGETQTDAAAALGLAKPHSVSMALALEPDPDAGDEHGRPYRLRYPKRGHRLRRAILRRYSGLTFSGDGEGLDASGKPDGSHLDSPTHTAVQRGSGA